jgi:streptogramin lyase
VSRTARRLPAIAVLPVLVACAALHLDPPVTALVHEDPADNPEQRLLLSISGAGFGPRRASGGTRSVCGRRNARSFVRLRDASGRVVLEARAVDRDRVPRWSDRQIVLAVPLEGSVARELSVEVCTPRGRVRSARVELWEYVHFDVPRSDPGTNPSPLALALDDASTVWLNEEFHTQAKSLSADGAWRVWDIPQAAGQGIFAATLFGDHPSRVATLGESVIVDPEGIVWMTEAGTAPYDGPHGNHARILRIDPRSGELGVYNVPGTANGVIGLAHDPRTGLVWFTQAQRRLQRDGEVWVAQEARLTSFDPDAIAPDPFFDFEPTERCQIPDGEHVGRCSATSERRCLDDHDCVLADRVCPAEDRSGACFREYELPAEYGVVLPGPLLLHSDGTLWYSGYWGGNHIGRFDPGTARFQRFPLGRPPGEASCDYDGCWCFFERADTPRCPQRCCLYQLLGVGPWALAEEDSGGIAFCGQEAGSISRLAYPLRDDPRCEALDEGGANPCIRVEAVPNLDPETQQMAWLARDLEGNLWFTQSQMPANDPGSPSSVGYLRAGAREVVVLPPLSLFPFVSSGTECEPAGAFVAFQGAGVAVDPRSGAVWFADYCRRRLGRVTPRP